MTLFEKLPNQQAAEMTKAAFAGLLGVSAGRVSQMIAEGLPVLPNGKVPVEAAQGWYRANVRQKVEGSKHSANELSGIRMQREAAQRDLLQMDLAKRSGALIDRKAVELAIFDRARAERDAHMAWVSRVAPTLAAELGLDLSRLYAALDREMRQHLQELSETPLAELLPALLSPFESWADIAWEHGRVQGDPSRLKSWVNTKLGETWEEKAAQDVDSAALTKRAEYWGETVPPGVAVITAGIDTQDSWLAVELVGWGAGEESWSLDWIRLHGDPTSPQLWADLDAILSRSFLHPKAGLLPLAAACMDSGGHFTSRVLDFTTPRHSRRVYAIKGASRPGLAAWPHRPSMSKHGKKPVYLIGTDTLKEVVFARLAKGEPGAGYAHIPQGRETAWFAEMTAEKPFTKYSRGRAIREWRKKPNERNEAFDCRVYAAAALESLKSSGFDLDAEALRIANIVPNVPQRGQAAAVVRSRFMEKN